MLPTQYAHFLKRFAAYVVDIVISGLLAGVIVLPLALVTIDWEMFRHLCEYGFNTCMSMKPEYVRVTHLIEGFAREDFPTRAFFVLTSLWAVHMILCWLYFALFESSRRQATPGKMMLGIFVTDLQGRRISFLRALGRTVGKVLSQVILWMGYLLALLTPRRQALHDMLAGTLVLEPAYPAQQTAAPEPEPEKKNDNPEPDSGAKDQPEQELK